VITAVRAGGETMAKKRMGRPPKSGGIGRPVRLDPGIVAMAKELARVEGVSISDYLSELLRAPISRAYAKTLRRLETEGGTD
jgi:hypothetical protein